MGVNPAVRSRVPIIVRVKRNGLNGWTFTWYLWRRARRSKRYGLKAWRSLVSHHRNLREAIDHYRNYADYWRTGQW